MTWRSSCCAGTARLSLPQRHKASRIGNPIDVSQPSYEQGPESAVHQHADSQARRHNEAATPPVHTYEVQVAAKVEILTTVRRELAAWAQRLGVGQPTVQAVELACYEAMSNVTQHAYGNGDTDGQLSLSASLYPDRLTVVVSDSGQWRERVPDANPDGGMGLGLIRQLADRADIDTSRDGTTVSMTWSGPELRFDA
ncbi:MAG: hypothetical protein GEU97_21320 [Actinophytocola sp.]|nr:hypothetical protein [Actinophytocola sp.]